MKESLQLQDKSNLVKTRSMSFRIPEDIAEAIETEAGINNINANVLVTQIFRHHIEYEGKAGRAGLVSFPRPLLVRLIERWPEKQVIAMAKHMSQDAMTDEMAVLNNEFTVDSFLYMLESWAKASNIPFRYERKGQLHTCIMQHDLSRNWSLYLAHLCKNVIGELAEKNVAITTTNNTVKIMF